MFRNTVITFALDDDIREFEVGQLQLWLWELKEQPSLKVGDISNTLCEH